ncbi:uncharacterized protein LOC126741081 [Anthonomus grandis grandis]|uniref:uncharacterized protein LOC126741081 n=1 Tax=Anthonomus grandis grandis TaxID=2921223 RepID=UPI0021652815|nr:uncharacterized protein LOC126741081 [Anthonomus grandis grandis]
MTDTAVQCSNDSSSKKPPKKAKWVKLPTPPPDPWEVPHQSYTKTPYPTKDECETEQSECGISDKDKEIFEYIDSLHKNAYSTSAFAPAIVTEEAFDHLDKLYKLMEQMLELREQNVKLHRRIRDLEHLNNLGRLTTNPNNLENEYPDLDKEAAFAQAILESILQDPKNNDLPKYKNFKSSVLKRHRSSSATEKQVSEGLASMEERDKEYDGSKNEKQSKVSKWTKVKAAFRWEKASNVGDGKSQDSGIHVPVNYEIARYLRVPSTSDETGHSPVDSGAGISTPGTISSASSNDDLRLGRLQCEDFKSSDEENPHYIPHTKDYRSKPHQKYQQGHHPRTPWAKMKEMIHPRNSLKKKHRLSAASDDIQIDVEFCSDNEDVFETEDSINKSTNISLSPSPNVFSNSSVSPCGSSEVPSDVIERYQRALAEDSTSDSEARPSRWTRVREAFLSRDPQRRRERRHLTSLETENKTRSEEMTAEEEIRRNYKKLQKKLSLEFQEKICEWERLKQNSPGISTTPTCTFEDNRDPFYMKKLEELHKINKSHSPTGKHRRIQMTREYELPPDFKKKMQEWEKIKKTSHSGGRTRKKLGEITKWKSLGGPRSTDHSPVFEYPQISEEFRKKLEEWKRIKASGGPASYSKLKDKTPSPKLSRKNSSPKQSKKNKELHWFEKELGKIEKEKQRLERERQKFIEREERLSKLRRSLLGGPPSKKEILIHTPSGFHRFEGISRKFTQKLYEWEKSQGIAPEASTFALLSASSYTAAIPGTLGRKKESSGHHSSSLPRSKSADSIAISALNLTCPLLSGHPSSLSLNDMDELERECLADSKSSSMQYLMSGEDQYLDDDEPEAVLVEVEDYEEETAEPFHVSCIERHQMPVYQCQEFKPLCESETIVVPKVRRSESARAQTNYDLMENIVKLLTELQVTEDEVRCLVENKGIQEETDKKSFKFLNDLQQQAIKTLTEKLLKLQEANLAVTSNIPKEGNPNHSKVEDILDNVQDISSEMLLVTDKMHKAVLLRVSPDNLHRYRESIFEQIKDVRAKIAELRRHLSYICAASDVTTPCGNKSKLTVGKTVSSDSKGDNSDISVGRSDNKESRRYVKSEGTGIPSGQGAVKKRIRYRQKTTTKTGTDTDEEEEEEAEEGEKQSRQHKKLTRTKSVSESNVPAKLSENLTPESHLSDLRLDSPPSESAVTLFVKTTRKLFTPLVETSLAKSWTEPTIISEAPQPLTSLPPLPPSPVPQRKVYNKEVSPGIKLIMAKYNQSVEQSSGVKSCGSSGSNSPVAWRSPVLDRRVKVQTEKYQEELKKSSPLLGERRSVQKSSSASQISSQVTARKTSLNVAPDPSEAPKEIIEGAPRPHLTLDINLANKTVPPESERKDSPEVRMRKIQRAKMEFLNAPVSAPSYISEECLQFPQRNRLSQVSVDSEGSSIGTCPGSLMKSASAGMINVDPDVYSRINPEYRAEGYVSLPRQSTSKSKSSKSAFSTIASKFRKVKMRKCKDRDKQVVETLCRQSLVVDIIDQLEQEGDERVCGSGNGDVVQEREPISKSNSWIKRSLFKR